MTNLESVKRYQKRYPEWVTHWRKISQKLKAWYIRESDTRHRFIDRLKNKPCMDCQGWFEPCQMDFDHRNPKNKFQSVSSMWSFGHKRLLKEIEKCDLICANCHRLRTYRRIHHAI